MSSEDSLFWRRMRSWWLKKFMELWRDLIVHMLLHFGELEGGILVQDVYGESLILVDACGLLAAVKELSDELWSKSFEDSLSYGESEIRDIEQMSGGRVEWNYENWSWKRRDRKNTIWFWNNSLAFFLLDEWSQIDCESEIQYTFWSKNLEISIRPATFSSFVGLERRLMYPSRTCSFSCWFVSMIVELVMEEKSFVWLFQFLFYSFWFPWFK